MTRIVATKTSMVAFEGGQYSVPWPLLGQPAWVRVHGAGADEQVIVVHVDDAGPAEVARHARATPGSPQPDNGHFPPVPPGALSREPRARTAGEAEFLALGNGVRLWLADAGTARMRRKMAAAVTTARLAGAAEADRALGHAAVSARSGEGDLASILDHHARGLPGPGRRAGEAHSLAQGTASWAAFGTAADGEVTA